MTDCQSNSSAASVTPPDPFKHVKYSLGMVLGVDDFDQEFAYLSHRDQWLARDLIGYGTVCGLQVTLASDSDGPRVQVSSGVAVTPRGQLVRVTPDQCAYLNAWLTAHADDVVRHAGSPPGGSIRLAVVLCYRDCPTDNVPVPGEPCRTETEATVASRLKDDFRLELRFDSPNQREEDALRDFVAWLSQIEITDAPSSMSPAEFLDAIRNATLGLQSPPDFMYDSPPSVWNINSAEACEYLRDAFRVWVTELRPLWRGPSCNGTQPDEECVLLAELDVPLTFDNQAGPMTADNLHEERRPFLIHLRMLQEWLLCGRTATTSAATMLGGDATGPATSNTVIKLQHVDVASAAPAQNQVLTFVGTQWRPANAQMPALPNLGGDATGAITNNTVAKLQHIAVAPTAPSDGQVLTFDAAAKQWLPANTQTPALPNLNGDATGAITNNTVAKLQHIEVAPTAPTDGQVLTFDATAKQWTPRDPGGTATGNFVEHPAGLPRYFIVAAGVVRGDGAALFPTYNDLIATVSGPGQLTVKFGGGSYKDPDGTFMYIVKALPVFSDQFNLVTIRFVTFKDGIILNVFDSGKPIGDALRTLSFMIEISQYEIKPGGFAGPRLQVDLNTATADELRKLPRIGPALADRIVAARKKAKGFKSLQDLENVPGIGAELISHIEPFVTVKPQ